MNVVFLDCTQGYGYNFSAANTKTELLARGLVEQGCSCTIINSVVGHKIASRKEFIQKSFADVVTFKKHGKQFLSWLFNIVPLYKILRQKKKTNQDILVLEYPDYHLFLLYILLGRLLGYHIVVISHEWGPTVKTVHPIRKPSVWLYAKTFGYFVDGILPISEYIINKIKHFNKPFIKVPVLADFGVSHENPLLKDDDFGQYFLYCVYASYTRVIFKIIDAFLEFKQGADRKEQLILVLSGSDLQVDKVANYIQTKKMSEYVVIKRKLPYEELVDLYAHAMALIVPLDPNSEQDKARFSQKIAEYTSSKTPIITNWVGEIPHYFKKNENIIIAPDFSVAGFNSVFKWCIDNQTRLKEIGNNGYLIGKKYFDYETMGKQLKQFFERL